jgi:hypothetical protein
MYFCLAITIGIFLVYLFSPPPKTIMKFPNLDNIHNITYVDDNNVCYKYKSIEVPCGK